MAKKMVIVDVEGHKVSMTAEDASSFAYGVLQMAIEAAGLESLDEQGEPSFGDFCMESPEMMVRVEQGERGKSIAVVARGKERPHAWLWFDEGDAVQLAAAILDLRTKHMARGSKSLSVTLRPERRG